MNEEEAIMTFMKLPRDLVLNCLARVSRMHYQTLSLVSKRFQSLLASRELYQTRTLLGCTENCLYMCLNKRWFIFCLKPNISKKFLVPIPSPNHSPYMLCSDIPSVGSNIYSIGRSRSEDDEASCRVVDLMVLDCHPHTWREAPSMLVARAIPSACVLDEKIYVTGGCENLDASNWMEVFDTKTQTWEFKLSDNGEKVCISGYRYRSIGYDGTIYVKCLDTREVHKLHKDRWIAGDVALSWGWHWASSACVIGNMLYTCIGTIFWYDSEAKHWKKVKGLERSFGSLGESKLADSGGKLAVLWEEYVSFNKFQFETKIWCGEIEIVKRQQGEIWGKVEWFDTVTTPNEPFNIDRLLAVTL